VIRVVFIGCLTVFLFGCASKKAQEVKDPQWTGDNGLAPPSLQQPDPAAARESDVSPIASPPAEKKSDVAPSPNPSAAPQVPPPLEVPAAGAAAGKTEQLGEMSASTPGAENVRQRPCDLDNCAVVLAIGTHDVAESVAQDDGGPGTYMPQGTYSAETASQPGVWDAYGVQKIIRVWDISVLPRDGAVQVIRQRYEPLFRVGDPVLINGKTILPWN